MLWNSCKRTEHGAQGGFKRNVRCLLRWSGLSVPRGAFSRWQTAPGGQPPRRLTPGAATRRVLENRPRRAAEAAAPAKAAPAPVQG
jgi:hypothetical protein